MVAINLPIGHRCVAAARALYWWPGDGPRQGALELAWDDGTVIVFDTKSDWTLKVADGPWRDPFEGADTSDLSWDLGRWTKNPVAESDPGTAMLGAVLRDALPRFSEVGELVGVDLLFDTIVVRVEGHGGDLTVHPVDRATDDD